MRFLVSLWHSRCSLTPFQFLEILHAEHCTPVYRFSHVFARDRFGQEYYLCQHAQLATLTTQHRRELLTKAISYRLSQERRGRHQEDKGAIGKIIALLLPELTCRPETGTTASCTDMPRTSNQ